MTPSARPLNVPAVSMERGVYRCAKMVPGMVAYFAIDWTGDLLGDRVICVRPGATREACVVARLRRMLLEQGAPRPRLRLIPSRPPASAASSPLASSSATVSLSLR